jgi:hypothetical protein
MRGSRRPSRQTAHWFSRPARPGKVRAISGGAADSRSWDAEEIQRQHPGLSLPQIYAALGYYFDNRAECDRLIEESLSEVRGLRKQWENPTLQAKLAAAKRGA